MNSDGCTGPTWKTLQHGSCWPCSLSHQPPESAGQQTAAGSRGSSVLGKKTKTKGFTFQITQTCNWGVQMAKTELQGERSFISERHRGLVPVLWTNTARWFSFVIVGWVVWRNIMRSMTRDLGKKLQVPWTLGVIWLEPDIKRPGEGKRWRRLNAGSPYIVLVTTHFEVQQPENKAEKHFEFIFINCIIFCIFCFGH